MNKHSLGLPLLFLVVALAVGGRAAEMRPPVAAWSFDDASSNAVLGTKAFAPGVRGQCLLVDGLTTRLEKPAAPLPRLNNEFAVSAWLVDRSAGGATGPLLFQLNASTDSPVINPAFVVRNWGAAEPRLVVNGREIARGPNFRAGLRQTIDSEDLIVWLGLNSERPLALEVQSK